MFHYTFWSFSIPHQKYSALEEISDSWLHKIPRTSHKHTQNLIQYPVDCRQ
jgi:hypothetical protein